MTITKKQTNVYIWIALLIIAIAALMPGQSGRQTYGREARPIQGPCSTITSASFHSYTDQGMKCGVFLQKTDAAGIFIDEKKITLQEAVTTYANRYCDTGCYDCATEGSPVGKDVCFGTTGTTTTGTTIGSTAITGAPPTGTVSYSNGDDWIAAQITIKNTLSDPISGMVSLEITTEEESQARKGFGQSFNCESKEDIQKLFTLDAGKIETTTLTSTNLPKGKYDVNVISLNRCCQYGCDPVAPFNWGDSSNQINLNLPGKITPTYTCGKNDGQCKSASDQGDSEISGTCPSNQKCYKEAKSDFLGFSFGSVGEWWNDRESWQKIAIVVGGFFVIGLLMMLRGNKTQQ